MSEVLPVSSPGRGELRHGELETRLRSAREAGRKALVPYVTAGYDAHWLDVLMAACDAGADALEVGIPFSDPIIDGPVIQRASNLALEAGTTPQSVLADLAGAELPVPVTVMTYYNLVLRADPVRFADRLAQVGVSAAILVDLTLEEAGPWQEAARSAGIETVFLVAPTTGEERLARICAASSGFVYGVGRMGVTGERESLASTATEVARRVKAQTDVPVLIGVGVSTPSQAAEVCEVADGVVVGSALMRRMLEGEGPSGAATFLRSLRSAIDGAAGSP